MKRRSFFKSIGALLAAPVAARLATAIKPSPIKYADMGPPPTVVGYSGSFQCFGGSGSYRYTTWTSGVNDHHSTRIWRA
jgi:hypothetical protein